MATVIQFPDALSLAGNISDIILSSAVPVNFKIKEGSVTLLEENYDPDSDNQIKIRLRDILPSLLSTVIPTSHVFEQVNAIKTLALHIDDVPTSVKVVSGGVNATIDAETFLAANWLTWQPQQKKVKYTDPEWLSYYATENMAVKLKAYFSNDPPETINLTNLTDGKFYSLNVNFQYLSGLFSTAQPLYFDIWTEYMTTRYSFIQRFVLIVNYFEFDDLFVFANSLGGIDTVRLPGSRKEDNQFDIASALFDEDSTDYDVQYDQKFIKNSGYFPSARERSWLNEFLNSTKRYYVTPDGLKSIIIIKPEAGVDPSDAASFNYSFTFALSRQTRFLNFPRAETLPENVEVISPEEELFFLAPRLIEFPTALVDDLLLFPVQMPFLEQWKHLSWAAIKANLLSSISSMGFISGEDVPTYIDLSGYASLASVQALAAIAHDHQNLNDLDLLSVLDGYLYINGTKSKAGDSDMLGGIAAAAYYHTGNANRTDTDWTMKDGYISHFIGSPTYTSGFTGSGWRVGPISEIDTSIKAEFDYVDIRKSLTVYELLISKIRSINGGVVTSVANGIIESVDGNDVTLKEATTSFIVGDRVRVQAWNAAARYYEANITAVNGNVLTLGSYIGINRPEPEDNLVQWGHISNTSRQNFLYQTAMNGAYFSVLAGINSSDLTGKETIRLGNLSGITSAVFGVLTGYGIRVKENGYFENVKVSGEIYVTGGNAETVSGAQAKADDVFTELDGLKQDAIVNGSTLISGGYINTTLIEAGSIVADKIVSGMKGQQFTIKDFEFNMNASPFNNTAVTWSDGTLIHYTIDPAGIKTWNISSYYSNALTAGTSYYIYASCSKTTSVCTIIISTTQYAIDPGAGYYYFLLGGLHAAVSGERAVSMTYGSSTITGRLIKTGKIASRDGSTYFDLDNNQIVMAGGSAGGFAVSTDSLSFSGDSGQTLLALMNTEILNTTGYHARGFSMYRSDALTPTGGVKAISVGQLRTLNSPTAWPASAEYGFEVIAKTAAATYKHLIRMGGTTNIIAGWNIDYDAIYIGTKKISDGFAAAGSFSLASNGSIHAANFYINDDGAVAVKDLIFEYSSAGALQMKYDSITNPYNYPGKIGYIQIGGDVAAGCDIGVKITNTDGTALSLWQSVYGAGWTMEDTFTLNGLIKMPNLPTTAGGGGSERVYLSSGFLKYG